ncbi:MAG: hypothetical protein HC794_05840 [Nitrospiraceae bacterium]|nr:hypothetical protein [Nitrospiraceae bacterium]
MTVARDATSPPHHRPLTHEEYRVVLKTDGSSRICILPEEVIGRIAAGEVVERPAAVVKELLENSIDAGSRSITIDVKDGGLSLIRVTDDGEGMTHEDAPLAFQRHATTLAVLMDLFHSLERFGLES